MPYPAPHVAKSTLSHKNPRPVHPARLKYWAVEGKCDLGSLTRVTYIIGPSIYGELYLPHWLMRTRENGKRAIKPPPFTLPRVEKTMQYRLPICNTNIVPREVSKLSIMSFGFYFSLLAHWWCFPVEYSEMATRLCFGKVRTRASPIHVS